MNADALDLRIRRATGTDAGDLLGLIDRLADYERLARPDPEARERLVRDAFGDRPRFDAYLADLDGEAVAYALVFESYSSFLALPTLYLEDIFVLPERRRYGIGKALLAFLAGEALRRGCGRMEWMVLTWNEPALRFYDALGARRLDDWVTYRFQREDLERLVGRA